MCAGLSPLMMMTRFLTHAETEQDLLSVLCQAIDAHLPDGGARIDGSRHLCRSYCAAGLAGRMMWRTHSALVLHFARRVIAFGAYDDTPTRDVIARHNLPITIRVHVCICSPASSLQRVRHGCLCCSSLQKPVSART